MRHRRPSPRSRWYDQMNVDSAGLVVLVIYTVFMVLSSCTGRPVTGGEPDIYQHMGKDPARPATMSASRAD